MVYKSRFEPVPVETALMHEKLLSAFQKHAEQHPTNAALVTADDPDVKVTFGQLHSLVLSVSSFLHQKGIGYRDVVCQVLPNCIEFAVDYIATLNCGGAMSAASAMFTDYEMERQFKDLDYFPVCERKYCKFE